MTDQTGANADSFPPRYRNERLFDGVRTKRSLAFLIDYGLVLFLCLLAIPVIFLLGFATLGAAWLLFAILGPLVALTYIGWTVGGDKQATPGMQVMGIRLERYDGAPIDFITAVVHAVLFWAGNAILTPFVLLVALFTRHKRLLHDILLGTVVVRADIDRP